MVSRSHGPLFETDAGRVIRCACGDRVEVHFQGSRMRLAIPDFHTVAATVARALADVEAADEAPERWKLSAETPRGTTCVTFTAAELASLHALLDGAQAMLELDALLTDACSP